MKIRCKTYDEVVAEFGANSGLSVYLSDCGDKILTANKLYDVLYQGKEYRYYNIINDVGNLHSYPIDLFEPLRDVNLNKLLDGSVR